MSLREQLVAMDPFEAEQILNLATEQELLGMARGTWWYTARPEQQAPPGDWGLWLVLAGRGFGKSRCVYEWLVQRTLDHPFDTNGAPTEHLVVAPSIADCIGVSIEGPSGILAILKREEISYHYVKSPRPLILIGPHRAKVHFIGADKGDVGRGYNLSTVVMDELCKFPSPRDMWFFGILPALRAVIPGDHPRTAVATTPKPIDILKEWVKEAKEDDTSTVITRGSTYDNAANLDGLSLKRLVQRYEGTSMGRQELEGVLLDDMDGPMFSYDWINRNRVKEVPDDLQHIVVGVDPCLTGEEDGDLMGCVVVGRDSKEHMYVIADHSAGIVGGEAARHIWKVFAQYNADVVVVEDNLGKAWLKKVLNDTYAEMVKEHFFPAHTTAPLKTVHSNQGKKLRAEVTALRYEQNRVHHVGLFEKLEEEMVGWDPLSSKDSPDRLDSLVHACRHLMEGERYVMRIFKPTDRRISGF